MYAQLLYVTRAKKIVSHLQLIVLYKFLQLIASSNETLSSLVSQRFGKRTNFKKKKSESCDTLKQKIGCRLYFIKFIL